MARKSNTRAAQGAGTIRKKEVTRNGKSYTYWEARVTVGRDPGTGRQIQRSITGKTQKEVREKLQSVSVELNEGVYQSPNKMTVAEWMHIWLNEYCSDLKPLTLSAYQAQTANHIVPNLGAIRLQELNATHIQKMYNGLQNREPPLSPKTIKNIHGILHKGLQQAVELGFIKFNPSDACKLPKVVKKEIKPLEEREISQFLSAIRGHKYERLFTVALFTGMRQGELLGLQWDDINFRNGTILVNRQLIRERRKGGEFYLAPLKNDKARLITPAPTVMRVLQEQRRAQLEQRFKVGQLWNNTDLVFTDDFGNHLVHVTVYKSFKRVMAELGLPETRFHDLRHTYAVASLQSGDDIKTVQENLGHHTAAFTLDTYAHASEKMKRDSADRMEAFIAGVKVV